MAIQSASGLANIESRECPACKGTGQKTIKHGPWEGRKRECYRCEGKGMERWTT
jgi:DnaJ-class molecular chaperone